MKRPLRHDELMLWARVASTIRPAAGRSVPVIAAARAAPHRQGVREKPRPAPSLTAAAPARSPSRLAVVGAPQPIEPNRMRRMTREREHPGPRLDLHGLTQDEARARLTSFLRRAHEDGWRAAMVITGKGSRGDGVLRRYTPEWLASPELRDIVAGVAEAHRRHGGEGALYVALKRRVRD